MVVLIQTYPNNLEGTYQRMVECDTIHKTIEIDSVELLLYKDGKLLENNEFKDKTKIFIMENGKTIDRIDFTVNER